MSRSRSSRSKRNLNIAMAALGLFASSLALADGGGAPPPGGGGTGNLEIQLSVKAQDPNGKTKDDAPIIEATIIGGPNIPADQFSISEANAKVPVSIKSSGKRDYNQGNETVAIALVLNGQELWIGNEDVETDESNKYPGILKGLKTALQTVPFASAGPNGSKGVFITYNNKVEVKVPMGPLANLTAEALGTQKDYYKKSGAAMVEGITAALSELHAVQTTRKALIVVSDGNDINVVAAPAQLQALKKQAAQDHVQTFAIIYKGAMSDPANAIAAMIPGAKTVNSAEDIATTIKAILERMGDRYYLTFPGFDKTANLGLPWDNKTHDLIVKIGKDDTDAVTLMMSPVWNPPKPMSLWWLWIVLPLVGLILIIILVKVLGGKKVDVPVPLPMGPPVGMPMVAAPAEAPKPAGPMKTVMFSAGGTEDGFPIVGWLVPLNGNQAFQTMRLRSQITKIGTQAPSDLVINDGFMSTEHCQIACSPQGFTLIDGGSTNGSYVNDKKVARHELVDNDTITLGKTTLKFKSIS